MIDAALLRNRYHAEVFSQEPLDVVVIRKKQTDGVDELVDAVLSEVTC